MSTKTTKKENLLVEVTIKSEKEAWEKATKKEYNKAASKVTVKGFRPGHVPADMVRARVNLSAVYTEALYNVANAEFAKAVEEEKLQVFSQPKLDIKKVDESGFEAVISFYLPPVIKLGQYKGLNVALKEVKVSAADVKARMEEIQKDHAYSVVKEGAAKKGDTVIIDFVGKVDGEKFDGGSAKAYELKLGSNAFIPGFEDQLVGIKAGETKVIDVTFPENYVESLKGKKAQFEVTCNDVKEEVVPELNEDFFAELDNKDVKDEASFKEFAKKQVQARKEQEAKNEALNEIIMKAVNNATVEIPASMVEDEEAAILADDKKKIEDAGLSYEEFQQINGMSEEEMKKNRHEAAVSGIKQMLVVESIINSEGFAVTDATLENYYDSLAKQYGMKVEDVKRALNANKEQVVRNLRNQLFTDFMYNSNIATGEVKAEKKPAAKKSTAKKAEGEEKPAAKKSTAAKKPAAKKTTKKEAEAK